MGIIDKTAIQNKSNKAEAFENPVTLDNSEVDFILEKLQTATYLGKEFETFYKVWIKLTNMKKG